MVHALMQENRRLREALDFYRDTTNYQQTGPQHDPDRPAILQDNGARARDVLESAQTWPDPEEELHTSPAPVSQSALDVLQERARQHQREGFSLDHDVNLNEHGDLALAGAAYAIHAASPTAQIDIKIGVGGWLRNGGWCGLASLVWPRKFDRAKWWKPGSGISEYDPRRCLVKAAALILAEIDRYDRWQAIKKAEHEQSLGTAGE